MQKCLPRLLSTRFVGKQVKWPLAFLLTSDQEQHELRWDRDVTLVPSPSHLQLRLELSLCCVVSMTTKLSANEL